MATIISDRASERGRLRIDEEGLRAWLDGVLTRHPAVGLAVGVVGNGSMELFAGRGLADVGSLTPITEGTVFRVGSITKLFTAIAVMQLEEDGLVDLDAPASECLRSYRLIPAHPSFPQVTLRHLLTHTAGIPEVRHVFDLIHPEAGPFGGRPVVLSVEHGRPLPSLAEYYGDGLRIVQQPGSTFAYTNHGFATLGQVVEDVSGMPLGTYFRDRIFEPLGMEDSDLIRLERIASRLATGYTFGRHGAEPVPDRDWIGAGAGGVYSTPRDMARFATALLGGGANEHGRILDAETLASMFVCNHRPDPRIPGRGLGIARGDAGGHLLVGHDGVLPGFNSELWVAPRDGLGVIAFTNGSRGAFTWMEAELRGLLRRLLDVPEEVVRTDIPEHPEIWHELCGHYRFPPRISDLRGRLAFPAGVEVFVRGVHLMIRALVPSAVLYRGLALHPDDEDDPTVFRLDLSSLGMSTARVVFGRDAATGRAAIQADLGGQPVSLVRTGRSEATGR